MFLSALSLQWGFYGFLTSLLKSNSTSHLYAYAATHTHIASTHINVSFINPNYHKSNPQGFWSLKTCLSHALGSFCRSQWTSTGSLQHFWNSAKYSHFGGARYCNTRKCDCWLLSGHVNITYHVSMWFGAFTICSEGLWVFAGPVRLIKYQFFINIDPKCQFQIWNITFSNIIHGVPDS